MYVVHVFEQFHEVQVEKDYASIVLTELLQ